MPAVRTPALFWAWFPILFTLGLLVWQLRFGGGGPPHVPIVFGIAAAALVGVTHGHRWSALEQAMAQAVASAVPVMAIMLTVGMIIGTWLLCGTVPWLTVTALALLDPAVFLPVTCVTCAVVSLLVGTSWGTVGTLGLALLGAGESLGVPAAMTAGAIVSGAWFGDKLSPLSDSTNFAAAMVGADLYAHIRNLLPTTLPAFLLALGAYALLGRSTAAGFDAGAVTALDATLRREFVFHPLLALPPAVVLIAALRRVPALPGIFSGVVAGAFVAWVVQGAELSLLLSTLMDGYRPDTGNATVDALLAKGGLMSMTWVVLLIFVSMIFGGLLETTGCLDRILSSLIDHLRSRFRLFATTLAATLAVNVASNIFVALAVNGRLFAPLFRGAGYAGVNVSRVLENGGTMSSPLIPWNAGGVFVAGTLGVPTLLYAPFAIANWAAMILDLLLAATGRFTPMAGAEEVARWRRDDLAVFHAGQMHGASRIPDGWFDAERDRSSADGETTDDAAAGTGER